MTEYRQRIYEVAADAEEADTSRADALLASALSKKLRLTALHAERAELYRLRTKNQVNDTTMRALVREIDLTEVSLFGSSK